MNDTQNKLYELMCKFDDLCKQYGVEYYLGGGSALGAVRHQGFLPWDDDVDLYITRENYHKLLEVQDEFFSDDFVLVNHHNFPRYTNTLVRCVDTHSTQITKARIVDDTPKGYFIELFILDPVPKDEEALELWKRKQWAYTELLSTTFKVAGARNAQNVDEELYYYYENKANAEGREKVLKELEDELFNIPEDEAVQYIARWGIRNLVYDIEWFGKPKYIKFENTTLPVPTYAENVLRFDYGDNWMYIPKIEEQITHTYCDSITIPYKVIVDEYLKTFDEDEVYGAYSDRKKAMLEYHFLYRKAHFERNVYKAAEVNASLRYNIPDTSEVDKMLEEGRYSEVEDMFAVWSGVQFSFAFWNWGKFIVIPDEYLSKALVPLLLKGSYSAVRKLLLMRKKHGPLNEDLQVLLDVAEAIRNVYIAIDNRGGNKIYDAIDSIKEADFKYIEDQFNYNLLRIYYSAIKEDSSEQLQALKEKCESLYENYPEHGEIEYCMGVICERLGETDAKKWYADSYEHTNHGLIRMELEERLKESE